MNPPKFDYYRAESVGEALSLMAQYPYAKFLAGGHSLIPVMNLRLADPGTLIDIGRIDGLSGIQRHSRRRLRHRRLDHPCHRSRQRHSAHRSIGGGRYDWRSPGAQSGYRRRQCGSR